MRVHVSVTNQTLYSFSRYNLFIFVDVKTKTQIRIFSQTPKKQITLTFQLELYFYNKEWYIL